MHFFSQYSSFASQLFDGHPLGNDSRWIVTQPTGQREERYSARYLAGYERNFTTQYSHRLLFSFKRPRPGPFHHRQRLSAPC
jgi:hypothetical protein